MGLSGRSLLDRESSGGSIIPGDFCATFSVISLLFASAPLSVLFVIGCSVEEGVAPTPLGCGSEDDEGSIKDPVEEPLLVSS